MIDILVVPGSLRGASFTRALCRALPAHAPDDLRLHVHELHGVPVYDQDIEGAGYPESVTAFRDAVRAARGVIFATPEYNGAMSGVIKNGIDWASRKGILARVPTTVISGSPGALGATKAQESLRAVLGHLGTYLMTRPMVAMPTIDKKVVDDRIVDPVAARLVEEWLQAFRAWVLRMETAGDTECS